MKVRTSFSLDDDVLENIGLLATEEYGDRGNSLYVNKLLKDHIEANQDKVDLLKIKSKQATQLRKRNKGVRGGAKRRAKSTSL